MKIAVPRQRRATKIQKASTRDASSARTSVRTEGRAYDQLGEPVFTPQNQAESSKFKPDTRDEFYSNSLTAQIWFAQLHQHVVDQYARRAMGSDPVLQNGRAWRTFCQLFEPSAAIETVRLFENLLRFANYEAFAPARGMFLAYAPMAFEHDASGEFIGPGVWSRQAGAQDAAQRVHRTLQRWCEWVEALAHFQTHELCRPQSPHRDLDKAIIFFWPLLKRHGWTYEALLNLLRELIPCEASSWPFQTATQLAGYCRTQLSLRNASAHNTVKNGVVAGQGVAQRLFKFLPVFR